MIRIHVFHTGNVIVDRGIPYKDKNCIALLANHDPAVKAQIIEL